MTSTISRSEGINESEQYLKRLCDRTFLSLWSYPGVYRDQNKITPSGDGKEVVDLLVVFGNNIILFSDRACKIPQTGNAHRDWSRWYRKAILRSAQQLWGAERWIHNYPDRLYMDRQCMVPFPLERPEFSVARFHRVLVAHDADRAERVASGGQFTLSIRPDIVGDAHVLPPQDGGIPFAVGQIDPAKGFIHVFGDDSLDSVMGELDTVTDFIAHLSDKEDLVATGKLEAAATERDLLADYLFPEARKEENRFTVPDGSSRLQVPSGRWHAFETDPYRKSRIKANKYSYFWDHLIESTSKHILDGTQYYATEPGIQAGSQVLSLLAAETRTRRRHLAEAWLSFATSAKYQPNMRAVRAVAPGSGIGPHYVFLLLSEELNGVHSTDDYREARRGVLYGVCEVYAAKNPGAKDIIGIASELGRGAKGSEDVAYLDAKKMTNAERADAVKLWAPLKFFENFTAYSSTTYDYPAPRIPHQDMSFTAKPAPLPQPSLKGRDRNKPCACGSGEKTKHCCGRVAGTYGD
ncbi:MAG: SEC-C domain-containing protein [Chloroflexota bacterium]|nr:SEC-C domain-containing protein [Chloroflexota bacterium]